jgi:hypothetical protein
MPIPIALERFCDDRGNGRSIKVPHNTSLQRTHHGVIKLACASLPPPCRAAELHR